MDVVKKAGHRERFVDKKTYDAVFFACKNAHLDHAICRNIANKVLRELKQVLKGKKEVKSDYLFRTNIRLLRKYDKDAAFLYETHRDLS